MYDNYHYPLGADTPDAPWNQEEVPDEDFEITCSQSLSKTVTVTTNNYIPGASGVDYERDDEGGTIIGKMSLKESITLHYRLSQSVRSCASIFLKET